MFKFFQTCFWTGTLFAVISFLLGQVFDFIGLDGDVDFDGDLHGMSIFPLKPVTIIAFLTVFGGIGMMLTLKGIQVWLVTAVSVTVGIATAWIIYRFIIVPLRKAQNTSALSQRELIGLCGILKEGIKGQGFGQISYIAASNKYLAPAKSIDGSDIDRGSEVKIVKIEGNIFYVIKK